MRSAVVGLLPSDLHKIDGGAVERVASLGFSGTSVLLDEPGTYAEADLRRVRDTLRAGGVAATQANGKYASLVATEPEVRTDGIAGLAAHIRAGVTLGADTVYVRPGGRNPGKPWWPHPDHHTDAARDLLVTSLREVARIAEAEGVQLALEGHVLSVIDTPEHFGEIVRAVDSPALWVNLDPVNFIGSVWDAWRPQAVYDRLLQQIGDRIVCAHWKDYTIEDRLVLHITEVPPGEGVIDHARWLGQLDAIQPDAWVMIEHLSPDKIPAAKRELDTAMRRAGLAWTP